MARVVLVLLFLICQLSSALAESKLIVATTEMLAEPLREIVSERHEVKSIIKSGVDPHLFRPTRTDIALLAKADVIVWNGLDLELRLKPVIVGLKRKGTTVLEAGTYLSEEELVQTDTQTNLYDPHIWADPILWQKVILGIAGDLQGIDPEGAKQIKESSQSYALKLDELHRHGTEIMSAIPEQSRFLITAHDAFGYFGRRYGIEVRGVQGLSTESEASVKDIEELVNLIVSNKVKSIFVETTVSERNVKSLVEGAKAKGTEVGFGGRLYSDSMGVTGSYEGTYLGMIDHNLTVIASALGAQVDRAGFRGQLKTTP